jgi:ABC-type transport system involved in cytochrome bd biosynthesis fused ATPase/permease subunit
MYSERTDIIAFQQTNAFASMRKDYKVIISELGDHKASNSLEHVGMRSALAMRIKESEDAVSDGISKVQRSIDTRARTDALLKSLFFEDYKSRQEQVEEAYTETFSWIFDDRPNAVGSWHNFALWLREGETIYWIQGKAGAGKSTLMSFIVDEEQTSTELQCWASASNQSLCKGPFGRRSPQKHSQELSTFRDF